MDAVYLFGGTDDGAQLRHSLRTVANLRQVDRVVVAGLAPDWLSGDVLHVPPDNHGPGKHADTWANLRAACLDRRLSDEFVLMNDDFFVLAPVDAVPVWHDGVLSGRALRTAHQDKRRDETLRVVEALAAPHAGRLSYELHVPIVMHRHLMGALMRRVEELRPGRRGVFDPPVWKRTLYGNVAHPGEGTRHADVKIRDFDRVPAVGDLFTSTSDYTWRRGQVGRWLRERFDRPSPFEREGVTHGRPADTGGVRSAGEKDRVHAGG
jgi:hypothetical protein